MRQGSSLLSIRPACSYSGRAEAPPYKPCPLFVAVDDPAAGQVVGGKFHGDLIACQDTDKFLRILPETWARTRCLFSNSTRNIAFGNGSITVAMTSMASSFGLPESPFFLSSSCGLGISSNFTTCCERTD